MMAIGMGSPINSRFGQNVSESTAVKVSNLLEAIKAQNKILYDKQSVQFLKVRNNLSMCAKKRLVDYN